MLDHRDLPLLVVFAAVVRHGSLTAAAAALGVGKSAVSEQLRLLEERSGARLLDRTSRSLRPTQAGEALLPVVERLQADLEAARNVLDEQKDEPNGVLRVATSFDLSARFVVPVLADLLRRWPALRVELHAEDRMLDLAALGIDVALRFGIPHEGAYVSRRLAEDEEIVVAAPGLAAAASVAHPRDLEAQAWVAHALQKSCEHQLTSAHGETAVMRRPEPRAVATDSRAMIDLVRAGLGFAIMPASLTADALASGALVRVLPDWWARRLSIYLVFPSRKNIPRRVSVFIEAISLHIRGTPLFGETEP